MTSLTQDYILVFNSYRNDGATGDKRRQGKAPVQYQIRDDTNIKPVPINRFLSHEKTNANYLAAKILEYNLVITSSSEHLRRYQELLLEENNHEERDTLMIFHAILASQRKPPDALMVFFHQIWMS